MSREDEVYLAHMLDKAREARALIRNKDRDAYDKDNALRLAVTHLIQIIGEAAAHVSIDFQESHQEIPWDNIIGMRHKIVHDYMGMDEDIVWEVVSSDLPALITSLDRIVR